MCPKVVGGVTEACAMAAVPFLLVLANRLHVVSSPEAAEMTKLLENTFRAVNITLANEFADVARLDVNKPNRGDRGPLRAPSLTGSCRLTRGRASASPAFPADPHYLLWQLREGRAYIRR